jgi:hypothetical protein
MKSERAARRDEVVRAFDERSVSRLASVSVAVVVIGALFGNCLAQTGRTQAGPSQAKQASANPVAPKPTQPALTGFPFTNESLAYTVNWPSGLSLGEGHLSAVSRNGGWTFELVLDAGIPGFVVKDTFLGISGADLCSSSFSKDSVHGARKSNETVTIDPATATATRHSTSGGTSTVNVPDCMRDALTYLFYARRELGQGRVPPPQEIDFGAIYNISLEYAGAETVVVNDKSVLADKMICHVKGPASDVRFEAFFDRDPARTPVAIRVPLPIGKFSLELIR